MIEITPAVGISEHELTFSCDRSPGPGGQNVNKSHTRVTLQFSVTGSVSLSSTQKKRVQEVLGTRISRDGVLRVVSCKERTQLANRRAAVSRFIELMTEALRPIKTRQPTAVPSGERARRVEAKAKRGAIKQLRGETLEILE